MNSISASTTSWLIEAKPSIRSRLLLWLIAIFLLSFAYWAYQAQIDELARGEGKVIPSQQLQMIQNLEGGIVSDILVQEGALVEPGQVLLKIDDTQFESNFRENQLTLLELQVQAARLRAEIQGADEVFFDPEQISGASDPNRQSMLLEAQALFASRQAALANSQRVIGQQIKQLQRTIEQARFDQKQAEEELALANKEFGILNPLYKEGVVSEVELLRAEKAVLTAKGKVASHEFKIPIIEAQIAELQDKQQQQSIEFKNEAQQALNSTLVEISRLSQSGGALEDRVNRTLVRSPVKGTVKQLLINTIGGVVQPGMDIASIVPIEDALLIEAKVKPSDIARIYPSQRARVKFTAYDFSIYGGLDAEVVHISADSIVDERGNSYYLVRVRTEQNFLGSAQQALPIIPGMIAQVDILTGKKSVLDYLLKPIFRAKQVALTER